MKNQWKLFYRHAVHRINKLAIFWLDFLAEITDNFGTQTSNWRVWKFNTETWQSQRVAL